MTNAFQHKTSTSTWVLALIKKTLNAVVWFCQHQIHMYTICTVIIHLFSYSQNSSYLLIWVVTSVYTLPYIIHTIQQIGIAI